MPTIQAALMEPLHTPVCQEDLLAVLCHELRTPLGAMQNALDILRTAAGKEAAVRERMHSLIARQVKQLIDLATGVQDVAQSSCGRLRLRRERVDLRAVVNDAIETLEWELRRRGHRLALDWPNRPVWVQGDAARLQQVFVNLLSNAAKYTDSSGDLMLAVQQRERHAEVCLRDSGIGIAADELPHIFDLYRRAEPGAAGGRAGLGIGLALVRTLVGLHGGTVRASSAGLGQGSEFIVRLPAIS